MKKPIGVAAYAAIEAAMARLLARIDGPATLTMARLASEAGVSRATLYRAPELLDRFRAALERRNGDNTAALASPDHIGELEAKIAILRDRESDEHDLRAANRNMAQHIQALSLLVREQEQQIAKLQLELSESARVVPLVGFARR